MSTRSLISVKVGDSVRTIYCHSDGYPEHHLPILTTHYNTQEKAEALVALGDLSSLSKSPECPQGHSFETQVKGYCVAYGRDRGETGAGYKVHESWEKATKEIDACQDYCYYWDGEKWEYVEAPF
jgi:hypothetical protein